MERLTLNSEFTAVTNKPVDAKVVHVLHRPKGTSFIMDLGGSGNLLGYLRPEKSISLTVDKRVPIPHELYRDIAYHNLDELLGWNVSAPVILWEDSELGKGTMRPFWCNATQPEEYQIKPLVNKFRGFGLKAAALDYMTGVIDRASNDVLIFDEGPILVDSGLSFVEGFDPVTQMSLFRQILRGSDFEGTMTRDLRRLNFENVLFATKGLISMTAAEWVVNRTERLIKVGKVL